MPHKCIDYRQALHKCRVCLFDFKKKINSRQAKTFFTEKIIKKFGNKKRLLCKFSIVCGADKYIIIV